MEKTKRKINRRAFLMVCSVIMMMLSICFLCFFIKNVKISTEDKKELVYCNERIKGFNQNIEEVSIKILDSKSLKENVEKIKKEYFENAVKIDEMVRDGSLDCKIAYLTFDDGPFLKTDLFLDVLEEKDVQATFFLRKREDPDYDHIYQRYITNCHTIGNHSAHHKIVQGIYLSNSNFINDVLENKEFIQNKLGITTDVFRFPGGSGSASYRGLSEKELKNLLLENGYGYVNWNSATGDGSSDVISIEDSYHNVIDNIGDRKVLVVLMHDYSLNTLEALPRIIDTLSEKGFIFLPLSYNSPSVSKGG